MIIDTDILIDYFSGKEQAKKQLLKIEKRSISMVTQFELFQGARNKKELNLLKQFIREWSFKIYSVDETMSFGTLFLLEKYSLSHGLKMADALNESGKQFQFITTNSTHFDVDFDPYSWEFACEFISGFGVPCEAEVS